MHFRATVGTVTVLLLAAASAGQDPPAKTPTRAERFVAATKELDGLRAGFKADLDAAKTNDDKQAVVAKYQKLGRGKQEQFAAGLRKFIDENPGDETGCDAAVLLMTAARGDAATKEKAFRTLAAHHAANPKVGPILPEVAFDDGKPYADFLADVLAKNPAKSCQGVACYLLGYRAVQQMESTATPSGDVPAAATRAEAFFKRARDEFGTVEMKAFRKGKLADLAGKDLDQLARSPVGKPAAEITAEDLDGREFKLSDYKGKVVLLDFWGTWCPPCMAALPHLRATADRLKDKPFAVVGVNADADRYAAKAKLKATKINWPSFWNGKGGPEGDISKAWDVDGWPTVYLIDHAGVVRRRFLGLKSAPGLDKILDEYVKLAEDAKGK